MLASSLRDSWIFQFRSKKLHWPGVFGCGCAGGLVLVLVVLSGRLEPLLKPLPLRVDL